MPDENKYAEYWVVCPQCTACEHLSFYHSKLLKTQHYHQEHDGTILHNYCAAPCHIYGHRPTKQFAHSI